MSGEGGGGQDSCRQHGYGTQGKNTHTHTKHCITNFHTLYQVITRKQIPIREGGYLQNILKNLCIIFSFECG